MMKIIPQSFIQVEYKYRIQIIQPKLLFNSRPGVGDILNIIFHNSSLLKEGKKVSLGVNNSVFGQLISIQRVKIFKKKWILDE